MIDLLYLARDHDLPPSWDGEPVAWSDWEQMAPMFICPPPKPKPCKVCGTYEPHITNSGRVIQNDGHLLRLTAFRCPDCRTDQVIDWAGDIWDLDPSDYTDDGSRVLR